MSFAALALFWPTAHFVLVLLLILGALVGVRRTWVARVHLVAALATGAVFLAGADCPLTVWEKAARADAGWSVYEGGFIEHYLVRPVSPAGITPIVSVAIVALWLVPSLLGHGLRWRRRAAGQSSEMSSKVVAASTPSDGPAASAH